MSLMKPNGIVTIFCPNAECNKSYTIDFHPRSRLSEDIHFCMKCGSVLDMGIDENRQVYLEKLRQWEEEMEAAKEAEKELFLMQYCEAGAIHASVNMEKLFEILTKEYESDEDGEITDYMEILKQAIVR